MERSEERTYGECLQQLLSRYLRVIKCTPGLIADALDSVEHLSDSLGFLEGDRCQPGDRGKLKPTAITSIFFCATPATSCFVLRPTLESTNKNLKDLKLTVFMLVHRATISWDTMIRTHEPCPCHSSFQSLAWCKRAHHQTPQWNCRLRLGCRAEPSPPHKPSG